MTQVFVHLGTISTALAGEPLEARPARGDDRKLRHRQKAIQQHEEHDHKDFQGGHVGIPSADNGDTDVSKFYFRGQQATEGSAPPVTVVLPPRPSEIPFLPVLPPGLRSAKNPSNLVRKSKSRRMGVQGHRNHGRTAEHHVDANQYSDRPRRSGRQPDCYQSSER